MFCLAFRIPQYAWLYSPSLIGFFWQIPKAFQTPKYSLHSKKVWVVFEYKSPLKVWQWEREGEEARMISHWGWIALSLKMGVCVVENLSRVFLFEWPSLHLWVIRIYIVWIKSREVTLKNSPGKMFRNCLVGRPYPRDTRENDSLARLISFQSCAPHVALSQLSFPWVSCEIHWFFI